MKLKIVIVLAAALTLFITHFAAAQARSQLEQGTHKGKVTATMNSGGYTYIQFEENGRELWAASKEFDVSVGDTVTFSKAAPMKNFYSRTLNRTFETILFVGLIKVGDAAGAPGAKKGDALPPGHVPIGRKPVKKKNVEVEPGSVKKVENGYTIEECYSMKDTLNGKTVNVRGRVVKFTPRIMGKNWIHIRDGSGKEGSNDLTVTTKDNAAVGDLVLVSGKIAYDINFGAGYVYKVIILKASVLVE